MIRSQYQDKAFARKLAFACVENMRKHCNFGELIQTSHDNVE